MAPPPVLPISPNEIPDDPKDLTSDQWARLGASFALLNIYVQINYARCATPTPAAPSSPAADPAH